MAGLLGDNYTPDPLAMGLLGLGGALMTPRQLGGGVGPGMQAFAQQAMAAQEMRRRMAADQMRAKYLEAQVAEAQAQAAERKRATEAAERQSAGQRSVLGRVGSSGQPGFRDANIAITGNAPAGYVPPTGRPQITAADMAEWIANGGDPAKLAAIASAPDLGLPEVARVLERRGADNTPEQVREDKFGRQVGGVVPKPFEMRMQDAGGSVVPYNPFNPSAITKTQTPDGRASNAVAWANNALTRRGQDLSDARARERLDFDRAQADRPQPDEWVNDLTRGIQVNKRTGESRSITQDGKPIGARDEDSVKRQRNAKDALAIIAEAEGLLDKATAGYIGTGADKAAQLFGIAPKGAIATGQLQTLQAALMMRMPRMEGPQSNLDVALYRESVGQIGDSTLPIATRKAALATVRRLQEQYAGVEPSNTVDFKDVGRGKPGGVINFSDMK